MSIGIDEMKACTLFIIPDLGEYSIKIKKNKVRSLKTFVLAGVHVCICKITFKSIRRLKNSTKSQDHQPPQFNS